MGTVKTGQKGPKASQVYNPSSEDFDSANSIDPGYTNRDASAFVASRYQKTFPVKTYSESAPQEQGGGVASMINRYSLFMYKGVLGNNFIAADYMDTPESRLHTDSIYKLAQNPTTATIIEAFDILGKEGLSYSWADFLYAKYHRKIPNNYLITVRRFAFPAVDNLFDPAMYDHQTEKVVQTDQPELARAVTWMGETIGNPLENFLSWGNKYNWKEVESEVQVLQSNNQGIKGSSILGIGTTGFGAGAAVSSVATLGSGTNTAAGRQTSANVGFDATKDTFPNFTEGPLNVIKKLIVQEPGLEFEQSFDVVFHYNLQAHGMINPKMAFLDIIANMLVMTYSNAPFWGGAARWTGSGNFGSPLGDHSLLASGDLGGFLKSVMSQAGGMMGSIFGDGGGGFTLDSVLGGMGDVGGDMLGGWLSENLNTPQGAQVAQAFLSGDPTGKWHVTVGNPLNPIIMMGNLVLDDTKFKLHGPLGRDDFPTELEVKLTFKHGRPRDKSDIEQMFNAGRGRLYYAPENGADILNLEGKDNALDSPINKKALNRTGTGGTGKGRTKYMDDFESMWKAAPDAATKAWTKINNVASNVTEG
jgi:hypothetical protein